MCDLDGECPFTAFIKRIFKDVKPVTIDDVIMAEYRLVENKGRPE
jgi:hypothetical protein